MLAGYKHLKGDFLGLPMLDWIVFQKLMASEAACFSLADLSGWSSKVFFPSHLQPWPGNENVQSPSTSKVLKSIRGMANWNQNICQIAEPSHRNRLFSIGKSSIYKWSRRHFAGYTPSFGPANGSLSSHVCRAHWCFCLHRTLLCLFEICRYQCARNILVLCVCVTI